MNINELGDINLSAKIMDAEQISNYVDNSFIHKNNTYDYGNILLNGNILQSNENITQYGEIQNIHAENINGGESACIGTKGWIITGISSQIKQISLSGSISILDISKKYSIMLPKSFYLNSCVISSFDENTGIVQFSYIPPELSVYDDYDVDQFIQAYESSINGFFTVQDTSFGYQELKCTRFSTIEGGGVKSIGKYCRADGYESVAYGMCNHAEGGQTYAIGFGSHAECNQTSAIGYSSHSEGEKTLASGQYSHAEGFKTVASGQSSHSEGRNTYATNLYSHAEGFQSHADGQFSHAEGKITYAEGDCSRTGGYQTFAYGNGSFVQGVNLTSDVNSQYSIIFGCYLSSSSPYSFCWNGLNSTYIVPRTRARMFNINPSAGIKGIYVGNITLIDAIINALSTDNNLKQKFKSALGL